MDRYESSSPADAEKASEFVIAHVRARSGHLYHQGPRRPPFACASPFPATRFIAEQRLFRVPVSVARALVAWADGFPAVLLEVVPTPAEVLAWQAAGRRCVSLLPPGVSTAPHEGAVEFALHDLCHLDKFIDASHHRGQVGFFRCLWEASRKPAWRELEARYDDAFRRDWLHVAADMNGSAVFLFAALKMKLKMAVRRRCSSRLPESLRIESGPLTPSEAAAYASAEHELLSLFGLPEALVEAARRTSAKRDDPRAATRLLEYFEEIGAGAL